MSKKVLIIEDNQAEGMAITNMVIQGGFTAIRAEDGVGGLAKIKSDKPDLVLLDIILPKMTGYDVLSHVKNDPQLKQIPIIVLTNLTQGDEAQKSFSLGAADHLIKTNITPTELITKIKNNLKNGKKK
ncbi:response regulator [Patescibacteria group bacterium]|nr:response regulator [Patescibacteria group bacterium]